MQLDSGKRSRLFNQGRAICSDFGDLFQNAMPLTKADIEAELARTFQFRLQQAKRLNAYVDELSALLPQVS